MILDGEAHKEYLSTEQYGIGFKKGNEELKNTVEATLMLWRWLRTEPLEQDRGKVCRLRTA